MAEVFGQDALTLCQAAWAADAPAWIREIEAVHLLRQVLVQTYIIRSDARGRQVIKKRDATTASRPVNSAWPPPTTVTHAGRPRARTCSGAATRSTSPSPAAHSPKSKPKPKPVLGRCRI
ncbi:hypothetical protein [Streptomyces mirabilis]